MLNSAARLNWLEAVYDHSEAPKPVLAVSGAILTFVNAKSGSAFPSIPTLAKRARYSQNATRDAVQWLEAHGFLKIQHRFCNSNVYTLIVQGKADGPPPAQDVDKSPTPSREGPKPPPTADDETESPANHLSDPVNRVPTGAIEQLVKGIQQLADKPGWAMTKAATAVIGAIKRVGFDPVRKWFESMKGTGKRKGWELAQMLAELVPESEVKPVQPGSDVPDLTPAQEAMRPKARQMLSDRKAHFPLFAKVRRLIESAGLTPAPDPDVTKLERQLAFALAGMEAT